MERESRLRELYAAFNARDIDTALALRLDGGGAGSSASRPVSVEA